MLERLQFLQEAICHYIVNNSKEANPVPRTAKEWKIIHQIEITLKMMGFWQRFLKGKKYVTSSFVPVAIHTIRQSFVQVITSLVTKQVVKKLTKILLNNFDWGYHPTTNRQLKNKREALVGHDNWYISVHPYFLRLLFSALVHTIF
jgi:hypothetical protein